MFYGCSSLKSIPDISTWDFSKVNYMNNMFEGCSSLETIPNIPALEKNISFETIVTDIFKGCNSLEKKPDLTKSKKKLEDIITKNSNNNNFAFPFVYQMQNPNFQGFPPFPFSHLTNYNNNFMQNSNFQGAPPFPNPYSYPYFQNVYSIQNYNFPFTQSHQFNANSKGDYNK